uniref:Putative secreted peptide n=1 Tax=Anopheles braziliensis TaxID=58242 RepID=A0A2M3ZX48_9DIPT
MVFVWRANLLLLLVIRGSGPSPRTRLTGAGLLTVTACCYSMTHDPISARWHRHELQPKRSTAVVDSCSENSVKRVVDVVYS